MAVDVPTGMFTKGNQTISDCLDADVTVTFGGRKICHALSPSCFRCGEVINANIGLLPLWRLWLQPAPLPYENTDLYVIFRHRQNQQYTRDFGHVAVWLGSEAMQVLLNWPPWGASCRQR